MGERRNVYSGRAVCLFVCDCDRPARQTHNGFATDILVSLTYDTSLMKTTMVPESCSFVADPTSAALHVMEPKSFRLTGLNVGKAVVSMRGAVRCVSIK